MGVNVHTPFPRVSQTRCHKGVSPVSGKVSEGNPKGVADTLKAKLHTLWFPLGIVPVSYTLSSGVTERCHDIISPVSGEVSEGYPRGVIEVRVSKSEAEMR